MTDYPLTITPDPEGGYVAHYPDLPGAVTQGETLAEVVQLAEDAKALWLEALQGTGRPPPVPKTEHAYSGKFNLRLPRSLHRALSERAQAEGVSLNQWAITLLAEGNRR